MSRVRLQAHVLMQYSRAPKNVSSKNGQAGVSRIFKNIPGWKVEDKNKFEKT